MTVLAVFVIIGLVIALIYKSAGGQMRRLETAEQIEEMVDGFIESERNALLKAPEQEWAIHKQHIYNLEAVLEKLSEI